jgi:hypothetical protein
MDENTILQECNLRAHIEKLECEMTQRQYVQILCFCVTRGKRQTTRVYAPTKNMTTVHWMLLLLMQKNPHMRIVKFGGPTVQQLFMHAFVSWIVPQLRLGNDTCCVDALPVLDAHQIDCVHDHVFGVTLAL